MYSSLNNVVRNLSSVSMPSIFIWKSTTPFSPTIKTISYYSGSNWFLEDYGSHSKSAMYVNQQTLSDEGIMYDIEWMPTNWVGPYLLEKVYVPYSFIREIELGTLEKFGNWMRFTTKHDVPSEEREKIWEYVKTLENEPCLINISMGMTPTITNMHSPKKHNFTQYSPKRFHQKRTNPFIDVQTHV